MSTPGWYPDPTGNNGAPRYWDGSVWMEQGAPTPAPSRGRPWAWFLVAMLVIGGLFAVFVLRPPSLFTATGDPNSAKPTGSQWNELPVTETPTQPNDPGGGDTIDCPQNSFDDRSEVSSDGRMHGGGLSFEPPRSSEWEDYPINMAWLYDHNSTIRVITSGWMSNISVGEVRMDEGFADPRSTAEQLMGCMASSGLYLGFTGREDVANAAYELDGKPGWRITADVLVNTQGDIKGDVVDIIVVDLGENDTLSVFISCATIENQENLDEVTAAAESLRVG